MNCFLIAALTIDGFIARHPGHISTSWTSADDKKWFGQRTKQAGVVIMGAKTFATIGRALPGRLTVVYTRQAQTSSDPNVRFTNLSPAELLQQLEDENYSEVAICGGSSIYSMFMKLGLITKLYLTIEPVVFGAGVHLFSQDLEKVKLQLVQSSQLSDQTLLLEYDVVA